MTWIPITNKELDIPTIYDGWSVDKAFGYRVIEGNNITNYQSDRLSERLKGLIK